MSSQHLFLWLLRLRLRGQTTICGFLPKSVLPKCSSLLRTRDNQKKSATISVSAQFVPSSCPLKRALSSSCIMHVPMTLQSTWFVRAGLQNPWAKLGTGGQKARAEPKGTDLKGWETNLRHFAVSRWRSASFGKDLRSLGACAMTTKFLDNKICTFRILLSWHFRRETAFF